MRLVQSNIVSYRLKDLFDLFKVFLLLECLCSKVLDKMM